MRHVSEQRLGKHVPVAMITQATGETGYYLRGPPRGLIKKRNGETSQLSSARAAVKTEPKHGKLKELHC
jgi:hypothetical protein